MLHRKNSGRWMLGTWIGLIGGMVSLLGCATPLPPKEDNTRSCYIGLVKQEDLLYVQTWAKQAQVGDLLVSRSCDNQNTEQKLNDIRRLSHERRAITP